MPKHIHETQKTMPVISKTVVKTLFWKRKIITFNGEEYIKAKELGRGGEGRVVSYYQVNNKNKKIVVKYALKKQSEYLNPYQIKQFKKEIERSAVFGRNLGNCDYFKSNSKNAGELDRYLFAQPYLGDVSLNTLLKRAILIDKFEQLFYFLQATNAVAEVHHIHRVHRDIKQNNFVLDTQTKLLSLIDFSFVTTNSKVFNTRRGTPFFMAPELFDYSNSIACSFKHDIYSLGVMFLEIIIGGFDEELPEKLNKVYTDARQKIFRTKLFKLITDKHAKASDKKLSKLIAIMLSENSKNRPSIDDVKTALETIIKEIVEEFSKKNPELIDKQYNALAKLVLQSIDSLEAKLAENANTSGENKAKIRAALGTPHAAYQYKAVNNSCTKVPTTNPIALLKQRLIAKTKNSNDKAATIAENLSPELPAGQASNYKNTADTKTLYAFAEKIIANDEASDKAYKLIELSQDLLSITKHKLHDEITPKSILSRIGDFFKSLFSQFANPIEPLENYSSRKIAVSIHEQAQEVQQTIFRAYNKY